jgi:tryptophan halogenase
VNGREALRNVVVVGGGLTGLCAAIGFARGLPHATVTLLALPMHPAALADRLPAVMPQAMAMFASLGIDERALVAAGAATHRVGERFAWGGEAFAIGEGEGVPMVAGVALHQMWLAHGAGTFDGLVPGAALATAERFVLPVEDPRSLLSQIDYTLRLDAERTAPLLAQVARGAGVRLVAADAIGIERDGTGITAVSAGDERLTGDLFVDASGPQALLAAPDAGWIDWSDSLPVDRLLLGAGAGRPSPTDSYAASGIGWSARWPLAGRVLTGIAYASAATGDARARRQVTGDAERIVVTPRRQATPFAGNVLALGDAAAAVGPLGWMGLTLALAQLTLALELMPAREPEPLLVAEYNRRASLRADRVMAYGAALYLAGAGRSGEFWHPLRKRAAPVELASALTQFGQRGTLPPLEEEMVPRSRWRQALIGLGVRPVRRDPVALSVPATSAVAALDQLRRAVAALPTALPAYPDYLAMMMQGRVR